jgi:hypothetical protein
MKLTARSVSGLPGRRTDWNTAATPETLGRERSLACGTPVLAFRNGSVPEVIDSGVTGEVVDSVDEAICKIGSVLALDRGRVRRRFETRFSAARMALDYAKIYRQLTSVGATRVRERLIGNDAGEVVYARTAEIPGSAPLQTIAPDGVIAGEFGGGRAFGASEQEGARQVRQLNGKA